MFVADKRIQMSSEEGETVERILNASCFTPETDSDRTAVEDLLALGLVEYK
jgi:hypothetical protein